MTGVRFVLSENRYSSRYPFELVMTVSGREPHRTSFPTRGEAMNAYRAIAKDLREDGFRVTLREMTHPRSERDPENTTYRVRLQLFREERRSSVFQATILRRGRVVAIGRGVTAESAFREAQKKAGIRGAYVVPRTKRWSMDDLFSGRPVFFTIDMR